MQTLSIARVDHPSAVDSSVEARSGDFALRVVRGAALAGVGFFLSRGLTFVGYLIVAQLIHPSDAGAFAAGSLVVGFGFLFAESGMLAALVQWPDGDTLNGALSTAVVSTLLSGLLLTVLAAAVAPLVGLFFHSSTVGWVAAASAGLLFLRSVEIVPDALLQRRFSFLRRVLIEPAGSLFFGAVAVALCAVGFGVWGLVAGMYARFLVQLATSWTMVGWRPKRREVSFATWRRLASYARHVVASEVLLRGYAQLDVILLGRFTGTEALGQYSYGLRVVATTAATWTNVGSYVLLPAFARIAGEAERFRRAFLNSFTVLLAASLPVAVVFFVSAHEIALTAFGPRWPESGVAIRALSASVIGLGLISLASEVFKAAAQPKRLVRTHFVGLIATSILLPVLLWRFDDVRGVAAGVSIASLLAGAYALDQACHILDIRRGAIVRETAGIAGAGAAALVAALVVRATLLETPSGRPDAALQFALEAAIVASVYLIALRLLARQQSERLRAAVKLVTQRRRAD